MVLALSEGLIRCGELVVVGRLDVFEPVGVLIVGLRLILPRIFRGLRAMRGLRAGEQVLHALSDDYDHLLGLRKTLVLLDEALVDGSQVEFLLAVRQVLEVDKVAVRHVVGVVEDLVLLEVHLEGWLVREVVERLFEFDEVLHAGKGALHAVEALVDGLLDGEQVALGRGLAGALGLVVLGLRLMVQVLAHAGLTEGHLVGHAEGVDD